MGLDTCLKSISDATIDSIDYEVIVADNGSTDATVAVANSHGATVLQAPGITVAGLRNLGATQSVGEFLAFIDADCTVSANWFESIKAHLHNSEIMCFGCPPVVPEKATWVQRCWYQIRKKGSRDQGVTHIEWLESMNLFVRREAFWKIDGFDESMITCEDYDLCARLKDHGSIFCDNRIVAIHHGEADTPTRFYQKERWRGVSNFQSLRKHGFALAEIPSVLFPLIHLFIAVLAGITLLLALSGVFSLSIWLLAVIVWQVPLLLLSFKKSDRTDRWQHVSGICILLNLYFLARGLSLFSGASWGERQQAA